MMINYEVPYYSQFTDISAIQWQKQGCGIASLAMEIGFYKPNAVSVDKMLDEALASGSYVKGTGWKHQELSALASRYGLVGKVYNFGTLGNKEAFANLKIALGEGPVIVSIHNKFVPTATLGHIVVVTGMDSNSVFYSDPASRTETIGEKKIGIAEFLAGWKRRFITVRDQGRNVAEVGEPKIAILGTFEQGALLPIGANL